MIASLSRRFAPALVRALDAVRARLDPVVGPVLALVLPVECAGCGRPDTVVCRACADLLADPHPVRPRVPPGGEQPVPVVAGGRYEGEASRLVVAWKDRGRLDAAPVLATALGRCVDRFLDGPPARDPPGLLLVPVPSSRAAVRSRGEDVVRDLARRVARGRPGVRVVPALRQARTVADQAGLAAGQRAENVRHAYAVAARHGPTVRGRPCLVVDDVVTTGASAAEAVRALRACGAEVIGVATICATPRRSAERDQSISSAAAVRRDGGPDRRAAPTTRARAVGTDPQGLALDPWNARGDS